MIINKIISKGVGKKRVRMPWKMTRGRQTTSMVSIMIRNQGGNRNLLYFQLLNKSFTSREIFTVFHSANLDNLLFVGLSNLLIVYGADQLNVTKWPFDKKGLT
jgi:hypothetical protein